MRTVRIWWKADRLFSGGDWGKQTFVHLMGQGANRPFFGGRSTRRLDHSIAE